MSEIYWTYRFGFHGSSDSDDGGFFYSPLASTCYLSSRSLMTLKLPCKDITLMALTLRLHKPNYYRPCRTLYRLAINSVY